MDQETKDFLVSLVVALIIAGVLIGFILFVDHFQTR